MTSQYWEKAYEALSLSDEVMAKLIERYRLVPFKGFSSVAESIFRSIVGQQITNVAAATLWDRLCGAKHGRWDSFLAITPTSELRKLGLNPRKIHALKEVAFRFVSGEWSERSFQNMADSSYEYIIPYIVLALCYLVLVLIITFIVRLIERRMRASDRR